MTPLPQTGRITEDIEMEDSPTLPPSILEDGRQTPAKKRKVDYSSPESAQESPDSKSPTLGSTSSPQTSETSTLESSPSAGDSSYDSADAHAGQKRKLGSTSFQILKEERRKEREAAFAVVAQNVYGQLSDGAYILLIEDESFTLNFGVGGVIHENEIDLEDSLPVDTILETNGFSNKIKIQSGKLSIHLAEAVSKDASSFNAAHQVDLVHLKPPAATTSKSKEALTQLGWKIKEHYFPFPNLRPKSTVLILDELSSPILTTTIPDRQWQAIKDLTSKENKLLWVTTGSQFEVTKPDNALIHGLARTMRSEDPLLTLITLDTESSSGAETIAAIDTTLKYLEKATPKISIESEFVERRGVLYISRIRPDSRINLAEKEERDGAELQTMNLHDSKTCIRLRCERLGTLDSLRWAEVSDRELPLKDHLVEVEIFAAGLNFKDLAVTMGIVPENEHLPGLEGAGVIRRVGKSISTLNVGQRVLVYEKGTFANRIQLTKERVYPLPDSMSFEDAATMPSVYLVVIYGLLRLANIQKNQTVLIHSASGGVGIAAIQLCQYIGAKIFATVGTDKKREFLTSTFGIPPEHIFSSRSTTFASHVVAITNGKGIDVVLNSLTGNLLDESWRCVSDGGTLIEIGKKDVLARNNLSMEPFNRNCTYRGVDMSHRQISDPLIASLLSELMDLVAKGHVKPISPITIFPFEDIISAFRYLRGGTHIGKVVISNGPDTHINISLPVRPAPRSLLFDPKATYLIVGGLRGLCGSLAIYLARQGAKHLTILCRSGYSDSKSKSVLENIATEGCEVQLFEGDVSDARDVNRVFEKSRWSIRGVIQGAMVLRDKIFTSMTTRDFHTTLTPKQIGTWNLHHASLSHSQNHPVEPLQFFILLSSISGVLGQKGQANYSAANVFLDSFSSYRQRLSLPCSSIDLGVVQDVGYVAEHSTELEAKFDKDIWTPINESLLHRILRVSILEQRSGGGTQLITGIEIPQPGTSPLLKRDLRFRSLYFPSAMAASSNANNSGAAGGSEESKAIRAFLLSLSSPSSTDPALLAQIVAILSTQFTSSLRLSEAMEPAKPLASYGLDSLAAVEFRNWARMELGAELTTLEIMGASSLFKLGERIVGKIRAAKEAEKEAGKEA